MFPNYFLEQIEVTDALDLIWQWVPMVNSSAIKSKSILTLRKRNNKIEWATPGIILMQRWNTGESNFK